MSIRYKQHPDLRLTEVEDEGVVLHLGTRRYFSVTESGLIILKALESPRAFDELVATLLDEYEVSREDATSSAREFVDKCVEAKLLLTED
jgi:hypothetical protein